MKNKGIVLITFGNLFTFTSVLLPNEYIQSRKIPMLVGDTFQQYKLVTYNLTLWKTILLILGLLTLVSGTIILSFWYMKNSYRFHNKTVLYNAILVANNNDTVNVFLNEESMLQVLDARKISENAYLDIVERKIALGELLQLSNGEKCSITSRKKGRYQVILLDNVIYTGMYVFVEKDNIKRV